MEADDVHSCVARVVVFTALDARYERDASNPRVPIVGSSVRGDGDSIFVHHRFAQGGERGGGAGLRRFLLWHHQPRGFGHLRPPPDGGARAEAQQVHALVFARAFRLGYVPRRDDRFRGSVLDEFARQLLASDVRAVRAGDVPRLRVQLREVLRVHVHRLGLLGLRRGREERDGDGLAVAGTEPKSRPPHPPTLSRLFAKGEG